MSSPQLLARSTLVLRHNLRPLCFWPLRTYNGQETIKRLHMGTIEPVIEGNSSRLFKSPTLEIKIPLVARLTETVSKSLLKKQSVAFNLDNLIVRDVGRCAYCQIDVQCKNPHASNAATHDHVMPQSRGGEEGWHNAALACASCNQKKANKTPAEAGMPLLITPWRPSPGEMLRLLLERQPLREDVWHEFMTAPDTPRTDATLTALAT